MKAPFNFNQLPYPANHIVASFVERVIAIEPDLIQGIYLTGSLPLNDFHLAKSDIDFIVVCTELPKTNAAAQIKSIHKSISNGYTKPDLSGSYVTLEALQANKPHLIDTVSFHEGLLKQAKFAMAPVSLFELQNHALTVYGTPSVQLNLNINPETLHHFLYENMNTYWRRWISNHSRYLNRKLILLTFPRFTEWVILGIARQLYTLNTNKIISKTDAGKYCLEHLPETHHAILREALAIRQDDRTFPILQSYAIRPSPGRTTRTIACAQYMMTMFNASYREKYPAIKS